jgi:hypothetical protein
MNEEPFDLRSRAVVATVTGVGNDPYGLTLLEGERHGEGEGHED